MDTTRIRITDSELEQRIHLFETPLKENEVVAKVEQVEDESRLLEEHRQLYADSINIPSWREVVLALPASNPQVDPKNLEFVTTTSYALQAARKDIPTGIIPLSVDGLVLTSDNKFVYGIRGGDVRSGKVGIVPAGVLTNPNKGTNPVHGSFYEELREEAGIERDSVEDTLLLGYQTDPNFIKGMHFVLFGKTKYKSSELIEIHKKAFDVYQKAKESGKTEQDARKSLRDSGLPNIDAWEHKELVFVENNPAQIKRIVDSGKLAHQGYDYPVLDFGVGALALYNMFLNKSK